MKSLLALALVLGAASFAAAQSAGNWQNIHGQVLAVNGDQLRLRADDGRIMNVDMSQVSHLVRDAMTPNLGVTVTGFPVQSNRFTARYIVQDGAGPAGPTPGTSAVIERIVPLVPQFVESNEFRERIQGFRNDRVAARRFVRGLYRGFFERDPKEGEHNEWVDHLVQSHDVNGTIVAFLRSPEYVARHKDERQVITDLYQAIIGRDPAPHEVRTWQQQIARR